MNFPSLTVVFRFPLALSVSSHRPKAWRMFLEVPAPAITTSGVLFSVCSARGMHEVLALLWISCVNWEEL